MNRQYENNREKENPPQLKPRSGSQGSPYRHAGPSSLMRHYSRMGNQAAQRLHNPNGLPEPVKSQMENAFQTDFSDVRLYPDSPKAGQLGDGDVLAYTQGREIHFAPGMYNPLTVSGKRLLGHELTHVVQQRDKRVLPTHKYKGTYINMRPQLEKEADHMGSRVTASPDRERDTAAPPAHAANAPLPSPGSEQQPNTVIQGVLTRSMKAKIQDATTPEDIFIIMYRYPALAEDILEESRTQGKGDELSARLSDWEQQFRSEEIEMGGSEDIDELAKSSKFAREDDPEDAAEVELNEEWHQDQPEAPEEPVNTSEDIEVGYLENSENMDPDEEEPMQFARKGNTVTGPKSYKTKKFGQFTNVSYKTDSKGSIDFSKALHKTQWKNPVVPATKVQLNEGMKGPRNRKYGLMPNGAKVNIPKASRSQHFAIGDRILKKKKKSISRAGNYTWHHLTKEYEMVLVDMTVHAKHGHNGGVYLWT